MDTEPEIFEALRVLCQQPGFAHAVSFLCFRDNFIRYNAELKTDNLLPTFTSERLIRTEISILIGLMIQGEWSIDMPIPDVLQSYITEADRLLRALHDAINKPMKENVRQVIHEGLADAKIFSQADFLREAIFYGSESAYIFQYRDFAPLRYADDCAWMLANKGFSINDAKAVVITLMTLQNDKLVMTFGKMRKQHPYTWTLLPCYTFDADEIAVASGLAVVTVQNVLRAFT